MHALRLLKDTVSGRDKSRETRKALQATRQRAARGCLLQALRSFLTADAFMYGPLTKSPPSTLDLSDDDDDDDDSSEPHTPERKQENGALDVDASARRDDDTNGEETDAHSGKHDENGHEQTAAAVDVAKKRHRGRPRSTSTKTIVSVTPPTTRTAPVRGLKRHVRNATINDHT